MSYYSVNLPSYTIGEGCYKEIPHTTRFYGKTAVVIGGKIAMSKAKDKILEGIKDSDVTCAYHRMEMYANTAEEGQPRNLVSLENLGKEIVGK